MSTKIEDYNPSNVRLVDFAYTAPKTTLELHMDRLTKKYYRVEIAPGPNGTEIKTICPIRQREVAALETEIDKLNRKSGDDATLEDYEALEAQEDLYNRVLRGTEGLVDPFSMY